MAASILSSPELVQDWKDTAYSGKMCCYENECCAPNTSIYSIALILETINAIKTPKIPMNANENRKLNNSAMYPITGGPNKKPKKLTLETVVKATLGDTLGFFPATL